jgi:hypothetical protein
MADAVRVAVYGTGRTGRALVPLCVQAGHTVVAGVVHGAEKVGADLGDLTGGRTLGVPVTDDLEGTLARGEVDVLLYAGITGDVLLDVIDRCTSAGTDVITASTIDPGTAFGPDASSRLARQSRSSGARVLGTGVNPGFFLDVLPAALASTLPDPVHIQARRTTDIGEWGENVLRSEVGVGGPPDRAPTTFLVTLEESLRVLARAAGVELQRVERHPQPLVATAPRAAGRLTAGPGTVEGFDHAVRGIDAQGAVAIELSWCGVLDPPSRELIAGVDLHLRGPDGLELTAHLEVPADPYPGTAARMVKAIPALRALPAGFYGPADLPVGRAGAPA